MNKRRYYFGKGWDLITIFVVLVLAITACDNNGETPTPGIGTDVFAIYYVKDIDQAIDVVFAPDNDYGDMSDAVNMQTFLDDVNELINEGFWQNNVLANNLHLFNFWYMTRSGDAQQNDDPDDCPIVTWPDWTGAHFAEVKVLVHPNSLRDCRWGSKTTTEPGSYRTVVHEASHAAFNLPDEYCCDGGYWNLPPILYDSEATCENDPVNATWRDCQSITSTKDGKVWWRSEDTIVDIMSSNYSTVWEYGPADWVAVRDVLSALPGASVNDPDVFAPDPWDWPTP